MNNHRWKAFLLLGLLVPVIVSADAIVRSQAMFAETIAEISVDEDGVIVLQRQ